MADFQNHRHFTLRCLSEKVVPVSIKLKSQVKTSKGLQIIRKAEVSLLNERIQSINNTINMLGIEYDTCMRRLSQKLREEDLHECLKFIEERKEARHYKTMTRQKEKLEILCRKSNSKNNFKRGGHSNNMYSGNYMYSGKNEKNDRSNQVLGSYDKQQDRQKKWVINISNKPLTPVQEKLLAHRPNYAIVPKDPPVAQYVAAVEHACNKLEEG